MISNQRIAITGTTRGIGASLMSILSVGNTVVPLNRPVYDLENISTLDSIDFTDTDCLILNAGVELFGRFVDVDFTNLNKMIQVNLVGNLYLTRRYLTQRKIGTVVIITSRLAHATTDSAGVYSATKTALSKIVSNLKLEYPDIRFVEIAPSRTKETDKDSCPEKKVSSYQQVADAIAYALFNIKIDSVRL